MHELSQTLFYPELKIIMPLNRRDFISGATAVGASLVGTSGLAAASGARDIRVAVIGVRSRGIQHIKGLGKQVAALCDCDSEVLDKIALEYGTKLGITYDKYIDYRELLRRDDIDAVSIATPNHTHCSIAIEAMNAGKHVYVEKPVSHNLWESRQLVAAARKTGKMVQCGTQSRSNAKMKEAVEWVQGGALGKVKYAIGTCYKPRKPIGKLAEPMAIPASVDYDLWCGPAQKVDLYRPQFHYDWHWDYNTGNGDFGNQGIHQADIARWFMSETGLPPRAVSVGGRLGYDDAADTPNTQVALLDYESAPLIFETRGLPRSKASQSNWGSQMPKYRGSGVGAIIQCEGGHVLVPSYYSATAYDLSGKKIKNWAVNNSYVGLTQKHHMNWLDAIAANDRSVLNAEIQEGHISTGLCHLGGVSHRTGEAAVADEIASLHAGRPHLSASLDRMFDHLRANDVDIDSTDQALTAGSWLEIDRETERFANNEAANRLFAREEQRPDYAVPDLNA